MTVTDIHQTKKGRYAVYVDGEFVLALHKDIYFVSGLEAGRPVTQERLEELFRESEYRAAVEKAAQLLSRAANTTHQLYEKLCRTVDPQAAAAAVARMVELGLMDDQDYARRKAADLTNLRGCGPRRVADELRRRGLEPQAISQAMEALEGDPRQRLAQLVERKYAPALGDEKGRRRTINALLRLGYDYEDIRAVLRDRAGSQDHWEQQEE